MKTFFAGWVGRFWEIISAPLKAIGKVWDAIFDGSSVDPTVPKKKPMNCRNLKDAAITTTQALEEHRTFHNDFKSLCRPVPGQDVNAFANEVMRHIHEQSCGALFDTQGAVL